MQIKEEEIKKTVTPVNQKINVPKIIRTSVTGLGGLEESLVILGLTQPSSPSRKLGKWGAGGSFSTVPCSVERILTRKPAMACAWDGDGR